MVKKIMAVLLAAVVVMITGVSVFLWYRYSASVASGPRDGFTVDAGRIEAIEQMVSLCTLEISEETVFRDSVDGKWIVAREKLSGRVCYDLSRLSMRHSGDTLFVGLPPETIELREDTAPGSYEILDVWDSHNLLFPRTLTAAEENLLKRRWRNTAEARMVSRGYPARARSNARALLLPLFRSLSSSGSGTVILEE